MFRRPRTTCDDSAILGRPPSPPLRPAKTPFSLAKPPSVPAPSMARSNVKPRRSAPMPILGRQVGFAKNATPVKGNASILNFFAKSDAADDSSLFVHDSQFAGQGRDDAMLEPLREAPTRTEHRNEDARFNEFGNANKRRKTSIDSVHTEEISAMREIEKEAALSQPIPTGSRRSGPFDDQSDSEQDDEEDSTAIIGVAHGLDHNLCAGQMPDQIATDLDTARDIDQPPALVKEETSVGDLDGFENFEGMDDFDEDLFENGDEFLERRYMEEQARLEELERETDVDLHDSEEHLQSEVADDGSANATCPICNISLGGIGEQDAAVHVNNCIDGKPTPLPVSISAVKPVPLKGESPASADQYRRVVRPPKPGQANPFTLGQANISGGSAFNRLMSGHAEDAAWAEAAAAEHASRGKPSYQRTCPFYKILPGLFICVDAFRYGAVAGCKAYFLSHFHSDHYVGLTATWSHGPIYCSKVTANLVRQQLRVDAQYVIPLDFEQTIVVPGTNGVSVSMISANHCPGSSLFLFEKTVGKRPNGEPRLQRILHCGDFRACQMHVEHPLLMPEVRDRLSGKVREQKIDVCYLDTTYLNPKYAFPSQAVVIQACADMCVCLSKDTPDESDGWETMKRQRAGESIVKFVQRQNSEPEIKPEPSEESDSHDIQVEANPHASQQILSTASSKCARGRLLVVVGTYSIGKERICLGIAKALNSKIYAPPSKQRIVAALEDPELDSRMTDDPRAAQVHMTPLFEIRAETLDDYLRDFYPHFTRAVGFRPSGWNYRPPNSRFLESPSVQTVLHGENWKSSYSMRDLVPQRGSSNRASCFGVPYSEHSSFRELSMFCCALRIEKIIPTVNVGSQKSRERMKGWCEKWAVERRKNGLFKGWQ